MNFDDLEKAAKILEDTMKSDDAVSDLKALLIAMAPAINDFIDNKLGNAVKAAEVSYMASSLSIAMVPAERFVEIVERFQQITNRPDFEKIVAKAKQGHAPYKKALKQAKSTRSLIQMFSRDDLIKLHNAIDTIFPDKNLKLMRKATATENMTAEQNVDRMIARAQSMTAEEEARAEVDVSRLYPTDSVAEYIKEMAQNATGPKLEASLTTLFNEVSEQDIGALLNDGAHMLADIANTLTAGKNIMSMPNTDNAKNFGASLKKIFTAAEKSFSDAGLLPDATTLIDDLAAYANLRNSYLASAPKNPPPEPGGMA